MNMIWTRPCRSHSSVIKNWPYSRAFVRDISDKGTTPPKQAASTVINIPPQSRSPSPKKPKRSYGPVKVIFSGIQPTGVPHLGNYLGALRQWKQLQDEKARLKDPVNHKLIFSIVDLHALTHQQEPADLLRRRNETFASLLAIGLDPKYSSVFFQSSVPGHAQLMWYLSNVASTGYLSRMTQWKSKLGLSEDSTLEASTAREKLKLGLFSYPVLQAADILLYNADIVPVGEDQEQHVEFARNLARSFNSQYNHHGDEYIFKIPRALISPAKRIMSLKDPSTKMSKSHPDPNSRILISDSPEEIHKKLRGALTDSIEGISYDPQNRPGVSNMVEILKHVTDYPGTCEQLAAGHANSSMRAFKEHVANEIIHLFAGIRDRFTKLMDPENNELHNIIEGSNRHASALAGHRMRKIEIQMGLRWPDEGPPTRKTPMGSQGEEAQKRKNKQVILQEQEDEERQDMSEPDVMPQKSEGITTPIAS